MPLCVCSQIVIRIEKTNFILTLVGIPQLVEPWALGRAVVGSNLPAIPEVTLGGYCSCSLTIPRCKIDLGNQS